METSKPVEGEKPVVNQPPAAPPTTPARKSRKLWIVLFGILMLIIGLAGGFIFFGGKNSPSEPAPQITPTLGQAIAPSITLILKPTETPTVENLKEFKNAKWQFTLKYNPDWKTDSCENEGSFLLFLAKDDNALGKCQSEFGGQVSIFVAAGNSVDDHKLDPSSYTDITTTDVTVDSVKGKRMSGTGTNDEASPANNKGNKVVEYVFFTNEKTYSFRYTQEPEGSLSQDVLADFDTLVQKHLTFSAK